MTPLQISAIILSTVLFSTLSLDVNAQTKIQGSLSGWNDDLSAELPSFLFLYRDMDGLSGAKEIVDVLTVGIDGGFSFPRPQAYTEVLEFEAPPWSWKVLVRPSETDTLRLLKPHQGPTRLRGVMAKAVWGDDHLSIRYDSLRMLASTLDDLLMYDRMSLSGAISRGSSLVDSVYTDSLNDIFENACVKLLSDPEFIESSFYSDLVRSRRWQWRRDSGWNRENLLKGWREESKTDSVRNILEKSASPGWCASWIEVNGDWYRHVGQEGGAIIRWAKQGSVDSIALALNCDEDEAHFAMWWWDISHPNSLTQNWWNMFTENDTPIASIRFLSISQDLTWDAHDLQNQTWTTPSNDITSVDELFGKWSVILVVKSKSSTSSKEWGAFRAIEESIKRDRRDIKFVVLSIDGTQELWENILNQRSSTREMIRWVGSDTRWMDGLSISSSPQVLILTPLLEVKTSSAPLPSHGLLKLLLRLPQK